MGIEGEMGWIVMMKWGCEKGFDAQTNFVILTDFNIQVITHYNLPTKWETIRLLTFEATGVFLIRTIIKCLYPSGSLTQDLSQVQNQETSINNVL